MQSLQPAEELCCLQRALQHFFSILSVAYTSPLKLREQWSRIQGRAWSRDHRAKAARRLVATHYLLQTRRGNHNSDDAYGQLPRNGGNATRSGLSRNGRPYCSLKKYNSSRRAAPKTLYCSKALWCENNRSATVCRQAVTSSALLCRSATAR